VLVLMASPRLQWGGKPNVEVRSIGGVSVPWSWRTSGVPTTFRAEQGTGADALQPTPCFGFRARLTAGVRPPMRIVEDLWVGWIVWYNRRYPWEL
jgi:hypothetical protein